jgi:DNA-directed RNA polymerase specialized sigma24 family protein
MFGKKSVIADTDPFSSKWAPLVLRFFQLFVGDQALAESLTIDTLAEHVRESSALLNDDSDLALLRRAVEKAIASRGAAINTPDQVLRAITSLPTTQRTVVALFRGLSLDLRTVAQVVGLPPEDVRQICLDAFSELHRLLSAKAINS